MTTHRRHFLRLAILAALSGLALPAFAADAPIGIAYQTVVDPAKVAQADGRYEKAIGKPLAWKKFESGAEVIAAVASGDIQIGYVGSSPLAAAVTRQLPVETFLIASEIGNAEALVVRNGSGIRKPADLVGKKVAVPFVSTGHYSLLAALKHWKIAPSRVNIVNLRPSEITAAWQRGDIDATYVWDPALGKAKASGKVLATSADVGRWGAPTFDAWIVRKDFAAKHPDVVAKFAKVTTDAYADYLTNGNTWAANSAEVAKIAKLTGAAPADIPALLAGNHYPSAQEQASADLLGGGVSKALQQTAGFLKEQKKVDAVLPSYQPYVEAKYLKTAR
ncbi:taurine ABC transporter substrate-binding protein [Crenobacter cavernae]|uniref:Taurine ABC transporter substrate-binding protein n=1 Tax=Crenobacter cavernae TaxID=2290923 RepID=A0A345Y253_9NEIS|nr:taurine ABC transporter substrate-binding protein [Crenobacter cavernae]AXK38005.1 taurine ABC transporter substrate-binding protein [Crenobacter cavernae]